MLMTSRYVLKNKKCYSMCQKFAFPVICTQLMPNSGNEQYKVNYLCHVFGLGWQLMLLLYYLVHLYNQSVNQLVKKTSQLSTVVSRNQPFLFFLHKAATTKTLDADKTQIPRDALLVTLLAHNWLLA